MTSKDHQRYKRFQYDRTQQKGSMIMEILLAFAIFSIICLPVLFFIFSSEEYQIRSARNWSIAYEEGVAENTQWFNPDNVNGYSNRHACDAALLEYAAANASGTVHAPLVTYPNFMLHSRNIPVVMQYIPYDGREYIVIGTNSASTSDPDLYVVRKDSDGSYGSAAYLQSFGPGIADFDMFKALIFIVQRSVANQTVKLAIDRLLDANVQYASASDRRITSASTSLMTSFMPLTGLPLRILSSNDWIFLGLEKNLGTEVQAMRIFHNANGKQLNDGYLFPTNGIEVDAGINDLARTPYELILASPNPIEFNGYLMKMPQYLNGSSTATSSRTGSVPFKPNGEFYATKNFDALGSSGNGKAIATYKKDVYFGRTVGNIEMYKAIGLLDDALAAKPLPWRFSTGPSLDLNKTILQIEEIFGGSYLLLLAKIPSPAIEILARNSNGSYAIKNEIPLPASPTNMTCAGSDIIVGMESATTSIAIIKL